jgi:hypothetical protein
MIASSVLSLCRPRFQAGRLSMTPGVQQLVHEGTLNLMPYLGRHLSGDWGDLSDADRRANDAAIRRGDRLLSSYQITPETTLWIITEADRAATTALLPSEY